MTLISMTGISGRFVAMSADKREVTEDHWYYPDTGEFEKIEGDSVQKEGDVVKVVNLSSFVLMGSGGNSELGLYIKAEMLKIVNDKDDLDDCALKLEQVIEKARVNNNKLPILSLLDQKDGVIITLTGFYRDNSTGVVSFASGLCAEVENQKAPLKSKQWFVIPPAHKYNEMNLGDLLLNVNVSMFDMINSRGPKGAWISAYADQMKFLHSLISKNHPLEVSKDGTMHYLWLEQGDIHYETEEFDTE